MRHWTAAFGMILLALPAAAQIESREGIALQNQILELRREVQALAARGGGSAVAPLPPPRSGASAPAGGGELTAALLERVQQLEDEVRRLRGQTDELGNTVQRSGDEQKKALGDLDFRVQELEGRGGGTRPANPPAQQQGAARPAAPATPPAATPASPPRTPELALREGKAALARRDYAGAEAAAREVLANRQTPRATDARFLLAEALYGKRDYQQAALAYDDTYRRAKTGSKAQDSLLGLANSFTAINEKQSACATLDQLRSEFPTPRADLRDRIAQARQRAGCR